jgi:hypothetical protein
MPAHIRQLLLLLFNGCLVFDGCSLIWLLFRAGPTLTRSCIVEWVVAVHLSLFLCLGNRVRPSKQPNTCAGGCFWCRVTSARTHPGTHGTMEPRTFWTLVCFRSPPSSPVLFGRCALFCGEPVPCPKPPFHARAALMHPFPSGPIFRVLPTYSYVSCLAKRGPQFGLQLCAPTSRRVGAGNTLRTYWHTPGTLQRVPHPRTTL